MPMHSLVGTVPVYFCCTCHCNAIMHCIVLLGVVKYLFYENTGIYIEPLLCNGLDFFLQWIEFNGPQWINV